MTLRVICLTYFLYCLYTVSYKDYLRNYCQHIKSFTRLYSVWPFPRKYGRTKYEPSHSN